MSQSANIYERDLDKNPANYAALTPLTFIAWAAEVYPERLAVVQTRAAQRGVEVCR